MRSALTPVVALCACAVSCPVLAAGHRVIARTGDTVAGRSVGNPIGFGIARNGDVGFSNGDPYRSTNLLFESEGSELYLSLDPSAAPSLPNFPGATLSTGSSDRAVSMDPLGRTVMGLFYAGAGRVVLRADRGAQTVLLHPGDPIANINEPVPGNFSTTTPHVLFANSPTGRVAVSGTFSAAGSDNVYGIIEHDGQAWNLRAHSRHVGLPPLTDPPLPRIDQPRELAYNSSGQLAVVDGFSAGGAVLRVERNGEWVPAAATFNSGSSGNLQVTRFGHSFSNLPVTLRYNAEGLTLLPVSVITGQNSPIGQTLIMASPAEVIDIAGAARNLLPPGRLLSSQANVNSFFLNDLNQIGVTFHTSPGAPEALGGPYSAPQLLIPRNLPAPGLDGRRVTASGVMALNNLGTFAVYVDTIPLAGGPESPSIYAGPFGELVPVVSSGDLLELAPGIFKTVAAIPMFARGGGSGTSVTQDILNDRNELMLNLTFTDNTTAVVIFNVPAPSAFVMAALSGLVAVRRRRE